MTWQSSYNRTALYYRVKDGDALILSLLVNQSTAPSDFSEGGVSWRSLGYVQATASTLTVAFEQLGNFSADAVRIQAIGGGNTALDDDFHVAPGSTTIDQGDPLTYFLAEPYRTAGGSTWGPTGTPRRPSLVRHSRFRFFLRTASTNSRRVRWLESSG